MISPIPAWTSRKLAEQVELPVRNLALRQKRDFDALGEEDLTYLVGHVEQFRHRLEEVGCRAEIDQVRLLLQSLQFPLQLGDRVRVNADAVISGMRVVGQGIAVEAAIRNRPRG